MTGCRTYGGHGEMMAVFASTAKVAGRPLTELIGTDELPDEHGRRSKAHVRQGGKTDHPAARPQLVPEPVAPVGADGQGGRSTGSGYPWPCGTYVDSEEHGFAQDHDGHGNQARRRRRHWEMPRGTDDEIAALQASYEHLAKLRDEVIEMGVLPPLAEWGKVNPNLAAEAVPAGT